jgi:hypothetical protein
MPERKMRMKAKADKEEYKLSIKRSEDALATDKKLTPEEELKHFKNIVKSLMDEASKALVNIDLFSHEVEMKEEISLLSHCLDFTIRLCEGDEEEAHICWRHKNGRESL